MWPAQLTFPFGAWRSVDHTQHGFFTESFIDELAAAKEVDAYRFRADLLRDKPRHLAVLNKAAQEAGLGSTIGTRPWTWHCIAGVLWHIGC
jgi:isoquinoline 1-oxidoreductase beta subunit